MTTQTDIDALIAAAQEFADSLDVELAEFGNARIHIRRLADALRQERERAEFYKREVDVADSTAKLARQRADKAEAELARAQVVIEKAKAEAQRIMDADDLTVWASHAGYRAANRVRGVLATYEKGQQS